MAKEVWSMVAGVNNMDDTELGIYARQHNGSTQIAYGTYLGVTVVSLNRELSIVGDGCSSDVQQVIDVVNGEVESTSPVVIAADVDGVTHVLAIYEWGEIHDVTPGGVMPLEVNIDSSDEIEWENSDGLDEYDLSTVFNA